LDVIHAALCAANEEGSMEGELSKSYVDNFGGTMNDVPARAKDWFQPDPAARRDFVVAPATSAQPAENVGGGDGSMVTASPSGSGTGTLVPGAGTPS
jgi:hypothetical protein